MNFKKILSAVLTVAMLLSSVNDIDSKLSSGYKFLGYDSTLKEKGLPQSEKFLKWQWPMFMLGPVVGAVLYLFFISFVKDNKERKQEIERQLRERRQLNQPENEPVQVNTGE